MGAVFAFASSSGPMVAVHADAVAMGMRATFALAALLMIAALVLAVFQERGR
jgi:hypothetical protein